MDVNIQKLLGADFKEGMTSDEILSALGTKKLADLSSGQYVDKGKLLEKDNAFKTLQDQLKVLEEEKNARLTEDEKKVKEEEQRLKEMADLKKEVSKVKTEKVLVGIGLEETDYTDLLNAIVEANPQKASEIAESLSKVIKIVKDKTEKDLNKKLLAEMGNPDGSTKSGTNGKSDFQKFQESNPLSILKDEVKL